MNFGTKEEVKPKPVLDKWDIKDRHIQIAQSVNLAVQELGFVYNKSELIGFPAKTIKEFAKKYDKLLTELKEELLWTLKLKQITRMCWNRQ